jgi:hypothetical protein
MDDFHIAEDMTPDWETKEIAIRDMTKRCLDNGAVLSPIMLAYYIEALSDQDNDFSRMIIEPKLDLTDEVQTNIYKPVKDSLEAARPFQTTLIGNQLVNRSESWGKTFNTSTLEDVKVLESFRDFVKWRYGFIEVRDLTERELQNLGGKKVEAYKAFKSMREKHIKSLARTVGVINKILGDQNE